MTVDLRLGDCLDIMPTLEAASIDAVIADIPYGTTACKWDTVIPFAPMWAELKRIAKPKAAIVLFGSEPFASFLRTSAIDLYKYDWIWKKTRPSNHVNCKNKPMPKHELILVFSIGTTANCSDDKMNYFPQGLVRYGKETYRPNRDKHLSNILGQRPSHKKTLFQEYTNYPNSVLEFANPNNGNEHTSQKPVALMEYLIRTYTNEGDTVLDFTMGSGTTLVACVNTRRNGLGIEKDAGYFEIAKRRVQEAQAQMTMVIT